MVEAVPDSQLQTESQIDEVFKRGVLIPFKAQCRLAFERMPLFSSEFNFSRIDF